ncbi:hypothetical protein LTR96_011109 [Exophiala xenobiotica]|nr:hypothetical protein LTR41_011276 [Exophiala xenobiotica]KAK5215770.1 hypothetical protein LTR72_011184 [Exophiala xenobiotica]KAK5220883.1 hypothetical protein LTR47_011039 [Exophiala xenobiotica]KAK5245526.1 hypothetical protein LTS06_009048 [Exophiala xenobiotica]KAK5263475.1 hypothetical protein LTR96_011109 [Exophiala xenobiotica]
MASATPLFKVPAGHTAIKVRMINPVNFGPAILKRFVEPQVPHVEKKRPGPCLTFLLEHPSGRKLVFDLGIRKDYENYAPTIANYIPTTMYTIEVTKNVADILEENDIPTSSIEAVIWSHWHWGHIGDPSTFPPSTDLIVGQGFKAAMLPGQTTSRNFREITFDAAGHRIGKFPAHDYFCDGSFYLLDSPGHAVGHLCGLARATINPPTYILMGGDICHYPGIFRPSQYRHMPPEILPNPCRTQSGVPFCIGSAWEELQVSRGRKPTEPLFDLTFGHDIPLARRTRDQLVELDCDDDVFVIVGHDAAVGDQVAHFPETLNEWRQKGWADDTRWTFLRDLEPYWTAKTVALC